MMKPTDAPSRDWKALLLRHEMILLYVLVSEWLFFYFAGTSVNRRGVVIGFGTLDRQFDVLRHSCEIGLLALARLPTNDFARHFDRALADASFTSGSFGPVYLANALRNHAPRCSDVNFLDRATSTLLALLPADMAQARSHVEAIRRQHVPR